MVIHPTKTQGELPRNHDLPRYLPLRVATTTIRTEAAKVSAGQRWLTAARRSLRSPPAALSPETTRQQPQHRTSGERFRDSGLRLRRLHRVATSSAWTPALDRPMTFT